MLRLLLFSLLLALPLPASAGQMLDGPGFDAATQGRTFVFSLGGEAYGAEQYLPGRRVNWSFLDGRCLAGQWWEEAGEICFAYEDRPGESQCWEFWGSGEELRARIAPPQADSQVYSAVPSEEPLYCMGPDAGV